MATLTLTLISAPQVWASFWDDVKASAVNTVGMGFLFAITYLLDIYVTKERVLEVYRNLVTCV